MSNKLEGSRVLITGGAGFIGSHVIDKLIERGVEKIVIYDNFSRGTMDNIKSSINSGRIDVVKADIEDVKVLNKHMSDTDYCIHLAAIRINHCVADPRLAFDVLGAGTFNVIEASVNHKIKKLVAASSASIYGTADFFPTLETHHSYNNRNFYGALKAANELMYRAFNEMYNLNYVALRFFNVYGPRMDSEGKYTEVLIKWYDALKNNKNPLIFGDGKQTMDFVYVEDVAKSVVLSLESSYSDKVYNVALGEEISLENLCLTFIKAMCLDIKPEYLPVPDERKKVEVVRRLADISLIKKDLGFKPEIKLEEGLHKLINWLRSK